MFKEFFETVPCIFISRVIFSHEFSKAFNRDLRKGYKAIVRLASNPAYYYARSLEKSLEGIGTDEDTTIRMIVNTTEVIIC